MDANLIFQKTLLGEQAMQDRGRLSQRELRTVLILVDGKRTVADISESRGNARATESILDQLEHEGFIAPIAGHASESDLERTTAQIADVFKRSAGGPAASATEPSGTRAPQPALRTTSAEADERKEPTLTPAPSANAGAPEVSPAAAAGPGTPKDEDTDEDDSAGAPSLSIADLAASIREEIPELSAKPVEAAPLPNPFATGPQSVAPKTAAARGGDTLGPFSTSAGAGGVAARHSAPVRDMAAPPPAQDPHRDLVNVAASIPATRRKPINFRLQISPKTVGAGFAMLLVAGVVGFLGYPIDRTEVEKTLSSAIGQPVTVGEVHTALSPAPTLVIGKIKVGDAGDLAVAEVRAVPRVSSLFGDKLVISNLAINGATVPVERLGTLAAGIGALGSGTGVSVQRVHFSGMRLALRDAAPQEFNGTADLAGGGSLSNLTLTRPDQTLKVQVTGQGKEASVLIEGNGWTPAEGSPYVFEALVIEGRLSGTRFTATKIDGRLLGGAMSGALTLDWTRGLSLDGNVGSSFMPTRAFLQTFGSPLPIDGELSGRLRFRAMADSWATLVRDLPVEGDFVAKKGNIDGLDLVEAVRRAGGPPLRGGVTKFDEIKGNFAFDGRQLKVTDIELSSGVVHAAGRVVVGQEQALSGSFNVLLRGSATQTRMPVALTGTLKAPELSGGRR